ncbi:MAG: DUF4115 domain-containing protein [Gammaproteobacteria bacterium]|nr:DUF4115 domain-containing protein [Gammaproteobacteria bacterium]
MENEKVTVQKNAEITSGTAAPTKGERLRQAREEKSLSYEDVVGSLNFEKRFLIALENDEHDIFPGRAYLYGYMRAYTRLLNLPVDEFVENLQFENESHEEVIQEKIDAQFDNKKQSVVWYVVAAIIALIFVIALFVMRDSKETEALVEPNIVVPDNVDQQDSIITPEQNYLDNIEEEVIKEPGPQTKSSTVMTGNSLAASGIQNENEPKQIEAKLLLNYSNASWTDIKDGAGRRLVYRMVEKGSKLELNASPPFKVLLGYSPGVTVKYNDKLFDHSGFEKENIAYFTLDNNSSSDIKVVSRENINQEIVSAQQSDNNQVEIGEQNNMFEIFSE